MKPTQAQLKNKLIRRINTLNRDQLKCVDKFMDELENKQPSTPKGSSSAGGEDLDEAIFRDLAEKLRARRPKGSEKIV